MATSNTIIELQRHVVELSGTVGRIEGKLDTFIKQMESQDDRTTGLEVRTRKVENRQHWYSGLGAALGFVFGGGTMRMFHG